MGNTPKSGRRMPDGADSPLGVKRSQFPDGESPNCVEAFDGKKEVFPLAEKDYLKDAAGKS
jgi:hypothetical protein